ncbi:MAG: hypothetical protein DWG82_02315 [Chloroflexi bacterium]|nr:hypothetical protein [Chloroflexota bacterium]
MTTSGGSAASDAGSRNIAWLDGVLVPRDEARVSVDDFGLRYGLTCFETMLARRGRVFRLDAHLDRLEASLRLFGVEPPSRDGLAEAVERTLGANRLDDAAVRLSVTPGRGGRPALPATGPPSVFVTADPLGAPRPRARLWVSTGVRLDSARPWRGAKVGQFAPYLLARLEAESHGADDALLMNERGDLVEGSTANLFALQDGCLLTPPLDDGPLPGVTRACAIEVARAAGIEVYEVSLPVTGVSVWDAAFLTSSIVGLAPIESITWAGTGETTDWRPGGDSSAFQVISSAYAEMVDAGTR